MTTRHACVGDRVELGTCIGFGMEPGARWGRLVGIYKDGRAPIQQYVVREYVRGDGEFPTGGYRTTWLLVPHYPGPEGCVEDDGMVRMQERGPFNE
jgi:hypothetical protein